MKRFEVDVDITMSCRIEVEAESEEQAKTIVANWIGDDPWHYVKDGHYMSHEFEAVNEGEPEDDDPLAKYSETYRDGIRYMLSQLDEDDRSIIRAECNKVLNQHLIPDSNIVDDSKITDLLEEFGADEELPEGWYMDEYDASEILMMI